MLKKNIKNKALLLSLPFFINISLPVIAYSQESVSLEETTENYNDKKISLLVLPFRGWKGIQENFYQDMVNKQLLNEFSKYPKFKIVNDKEFDQLIKEIDIDQNIDNVLNFAREKQIPNIIIPKFKENDLNFNDLDFSQTNFIPGRKVVFQIEMIDTSTGDRRVIAEKTLTQLRKIYGSNFYSLIEREFKEQITYLAGKVDDQFLIRGKVKVNQDSLALDKGTDSGVKVGMIFNVKSQEKSKNNFQYTKDSYLRVTSVSENTSNLILLSGINPKDNSDALEAKRPPNLQGIITELNQSGFDKTLMLNIGTDQGVKVGQVYKVYETLSFKDSKTGKEFTVGDKEKGLIYITETDTDKASGKIIRGSADIKANMKISEYKSSYLETFFKVAYYFYKPINPQISKNNLLRVSTGFQDLRYLYFFDFGIDASIVPVDLNATRAIEPGTPSTSRIIYSPSITGINGSAGYNFTLIPEYIHVAPMLQAGFGLSDNQNRNVVFDIVPKAVLKFTYSHASLWLEGGYSLNIPFRNNASLPNTSSFIYGGGLSVSF